MEPQELGNTRGETTPSGAEIGTMAEIESANAFLATPKQTATPIQVPATTIGTPSISTPSLKTTPSPLDTPLAALKEQALALQQKVQELSQPETQEAPTPISPRDLVQRRLLEVFEEGQNFDVSQIKEEAGVYGQRDIVNRLAQSYDAALLEQRRTIQAMRENPEGKLAGSLQAGIENYKYESDQNLADKAMQLHYARQDYSAMQEVANDAIAAEQQRYDRQIDFFTQMYDMLGDDLTESEKIKYQSDLNVLERQTTELGQAKQEAVKFATENGAPADTLSAIKNAQTAPDVWLEAGKFGVDPMNTLQKEQYRAAIANSWANYNLSELKLQNERDKQAQLQSAIASGRVVLDENQSDLALKIGKEYENEAGEFKKQVASYNRIIASAQEPSAAGDLALIFNYMKLLDPGSVVREGEFANAQNAGGVPARIQAQYNNLLKGERLTVGQRTDFVDRSQKIYDASLEQQIALENRYREKAVDLFGLPQNAANMIVQDIRATGTASEVGFGLMMDNLSVEQMEILQRQGLLTTTTQSF